MNVNNSKLRKGVSILTILLFALLCVNFILRLSGRILFYETWAKIDSHIIIGLSALFSLTLFLVLRLTHLITKIIIVFGVLIMGGYIYFLGLLVSVDHVTYEKEGYIIYVKEWRYYFTGSDAFYLKENFLTSVYIGSGQQSEEIRTIYYIEDNVFHIVERLENGDLIHHETIPLPSS